MLNQQQVNNINFQNSYDNKNQSQERVQHVGYMSIAPARSDP